MASPRSRVKTLIKKHNIRNFDQLGFYVTDNNQEMIQKEVYGHLGYWMDFFEAKDLAVEVFGSSD